jgi:threonylcarbamoyladenosine tRNA methylthiotransferase MtaB
MPQVDGRLIRERARRLREAGDAALLKRLDAEIGREREVLIESDSQGRTEHYLPVAVSGETPGSIRRVSIAGHHNARLSV